MNTFFIIHGSFNNSKGNWFPWLEEKLKTQGNEVYNLDYPFGDEQNYENWSRILDKHKDKINENTCFVCHSIACVFVVKYCILNKIKIKKAIFVAGFNNSFGLLEDYNKVNKTFFTDKLNEFKNCCNNRICIYSKNDPYLKFFELEDFANKIETTQKVVYEMAGHINAESGYTTFEDVLKFVN